MNTGPLGICHSSGNTEEELCYGVQAIVARLAASKLPDYDT